MSSSVRWDATVCKHSLVRGGDLAPHCDSGVLGAGMPVHSVELYHMASLQHLNPFRQLFISIY